MTPRTVLAIDGNSLTHRAHHALKQTDERDAEGRPVWAAKGFLDLLAGITDMTRPDAVVIGFDDTTTPNHRRIQYPDYKATRSAHHPDLAHELTEIPRLLARLGLTVAVPPGAEADDVLASTAHWAARHGWHAVLATSDRDSFSAISPTTRVLKIANGLKNSPLIDEAALHATEGVHPHQYLDYAALRGDSSDNLPGVRGIGEKTAAALLAHLGTGAAAFDDAAAEGTRVTAATGKAAVGKLNAPGAREAFERNRKLMRLNTSAWQPATAPLTAPGTGAPLTDPRRTEAVLRAAGITVSSRTLRNLTQTGLRTLSQSGQALTDPF